MENGSAAPAAEGKPRRGEGVAETKASYAARVKAAAAEAAAAKEEAAAAAAATPTPAPPKGAKADKGGKPKHTHLSLSPGLVDWLATGLLLREAGRAEGLDKLLADLGQEHFGQVFFQLRSKSFSGLAPLLEAQARPSANNGGSGKASPSPGLCYRNARMEALLDPAKGAWEAAKLYAPPLGPRGMASEVAGPKNADAVTKLAILGNYRAYYPVIGEWPTAAAAALAREWVASGGWVRGKEAGAPKVEDARAVLVALLEAAAAVYPPVREGLTGSAERLRSMDAKGQAESLTLEQALSLMMDRARPLVHEMWSLDKAIEEDAAEERGTHLNLGQLARRRQQAEVELSGLQAAADGVSDKMGNALRSAMAALREAQAESERREKGREEERRAQEQAALEAARHTPHVEAEDSAAQEEQAVPGGEGSEEEQAEWAQFVAGHAGVRDPVWRKLNALRALFLRRQFKEVMRETLLAISGKGEKEGQEGSLLPVEHHAMQEMLARGALHDGRLALALSSLNKASTPPPNSTTSDIPPCFAYSPTALRLRHRALAATERQTPDPAASVELLGKAIATWEEIKDEDLLSQDLVLRAASCLHYALALYQKMQSTTERGDLPARLPICEEALKRLRQGVACFEQGADEDEEKEEKEEKEEADTDTKMTTTTAAAAAAAAAAEPSLPTYPPTLRRMTRARHPLIFIHLNRMLGVYYGEAALSSAVPDRLERGIAYYHEAVAELTALWARAGMREELEAQYLGQFRWELAQMYLKRRKDDTDFIAALVLLEQALEVLRDDEERANVYRFLAEAFTERGKASRNEADLRRAADAFEQAAEHLGKGPRAEKGAEKHAHAIATLLRNAAHIYVMLAELKGQQQQHEEEGQGQSEEGGPGGGGMGGAEVEKAVNRFMRAFEIFRRQAEQQAPPGGVVASCMVDAGATALTLGKLHANRAGVGGGISGSRRRKAVDAAILWFEQAEACFRGAAPGRDKQNRYINAYVPIYAALAALYTERAGLRKEKEEPGKASDRKQAEAYGKKHVEAEEGAKSRAEATAALAQEKLKEIKL